MAKESIKLTREDERFVNEPRIKHKIKDSVFCDLFADPEYQLKLYEELHPEDKDVTVSDFNTLTIHNVMTDQQYNDLGFTVHDKLLILVEAQSKWSINIILRIIMYYAQTLHKYTIEAGKDIYGSRKLEVPRPEFYVVYTGADKKDVKNAYSLADEFFGGDDTFIDIKVRIIRAEEGSRNIIQQYIAFTKIVDEQIRIHGKNADAVREAIRICVDQDILKEYLGDREKEVISIMTTLFDQEEISRAYGKAQREEGREEQAKKTAINLYKAGMEPKQIASAVGYSVEKVEEWIGLRIA